MKALLLAAGKGSRISDVTEGKPKSMLPLADTTLAGHSLQRLWDAGIRDLVVVLGYERHVLEAHIRAEWQGALEVVYNPHFKTTNVLYSFWLATPFLRGKDFIFLHADTVFEQSVLTALIDHDAGAQLVFAVDRHPCEEEEMKVQIEDGIVRLVTKQMPSDAADGEFLGVARVSAGLLPHLVTAANTLFENEEFQSFFELAVQKLIDGGQLDVTVADVTGAKWREIDFPEDYEAAQALFN